MAGTSDVIRLVLLAFFCGVATTALVQLVVTLRTLQRTALSIERQVTETSRELSEVLGGLRPESSGKDALSLLASAAVPAVIAGLRAFRAHPAAEPIPPSTTATASNGVPNHEEKTS